MSTSDADPAGPAFYALRSPNSSASELLHRGLSYLNERRLRPALPAEGWRDDLALEARWRDVEGDMLERARAFVATRAEEAPCDAERFVRWFEQLREVGPGQNDPLFPWLASEASYEDLRWFLTQEVTGEAGFDDLVALTQLRMPEQAKLELGRNYWDELGRGKACGMHGPMLARLAGCLKVDASTPRVWEALALANLLVGLAANRRYAFHAVGALGVIELTAPGRAEFVNAGLRRIGVEAHHRQYFALHATLDVQHSAAWNQEVLLPLVRAEPRVARAIAEGALMRLVAGARCFERYRVHFGLS